MHDLHVQMLCDDLRGFGDTEEAEAIRSQFEGLWDEMSHEEADAVSELSADLYQQYGAI